MAALIGEDWVTDRPLQLPERGPAGFTAPPPPLTYVDHDVLIKRVDLQISSAQPVYTFVRAGDRIPFELAHLPIITCVTGSAVARGSAGSTHAAMATAQAQAQAQAEAAAQADAQADTSTSTSTSTTNSEV